MTLRITAAILKYMSVQCKHEKIHKGKSPGQKLFLGNAPQIFTRTSSCLSHTSGRNYFNQDLIQTRILPVVYGLDGTAWTLFKVDSRQTRKVFQMQCLQLILGVSSPQSLFETRHQTKMLRQPMIKEEIQRRGLRRFNHMCRMNASWLPCRLLCKKQSTQLKEDMNQASSKQSEESKTLRHG